MRRIVKLTLRAVLFGDMARGGYLQEYEILDEGKPIGRKSVIAETRRAMPKETYQIDGDDRTFTNSAAFIAAYQDKVDEEERNANRN